MNSKTLPVEWGWNAGKRQRNIEVSNVLGVVYTYFMYDDVSMTNFLEVCI